MPEKLSVVFEDATEYEKNPGFETRLKKSFEVSHKILRSLPLICIYSIFIVFAFLMIWHAECNRYERLFESLCTIMLGYVGTIITVYWNTDNLYGRKWTLIFNEFYEINRIQDEADRDFHYCNLWIDAITLGVWGDEALNRSLLQHLERALVKVEQCKTKGLKEKLYVSKLTKAEAKKLLRSYAEYLLEQH